MKIALALGSGAARGLAHIGVLKFLEENDIKPDIITGSSMGAFLGSLYATGLSVREMEKIAKELNWRKLGGYLDISLRHGLIEGQKFEDFLSHLIPVDTFENCKTTLGLVSTDLTSGEKMYHAAGPLIPAIHASMAFPGIFSPVVAGKDVLLDGGLVEPVPYGIAQSLGADFIIGVNVVPHVSHHFKKIPATKTFFHRFTESHLNAPLLEEWLMKFKHDKSPAQTESVFQVFYKSLIILQNSLADAEFSQYKDTSVQIRPVLKRVRLFDFYRAEEIIEQGYQAAAQRGKTIKKRYQQALKEHSE